MTWFLLTLAAVVAIILWKASKKDLYYSRTPHTHANSSPITSKLSIKTDELQHSTLESDTDSPLDKDAWEDWSEELYAKASRELREELKITYCDRNGQITHRDITVEKYARTSDGGVLAAFCHLRQARRPFYFSRIQFVANRNDGAVIKDLGAWLDERYESTPKGVRDRFIENHEAALGALFFVAKADNAFNHKEKEILRSFCAYQGLDDTKIQELVVELVAGWVVPSRIAYGKDLQALLYRDEPYRRAVLENAKAIVSTGKTIRDEEVRALERMRRELNLSE